METQTPPLTQPHMPMSSTPQVARPAQATPPAQAHTTPPVVRPAQNPPAQAPAAPAGQPSTKPAASGKPAKKPRPARNSKPSKTLIRSIAQTATKLHRLDDATRQLLAKILDTTPDPTELTIAVYDTGKTAIKQLDTIADYMGMNEMDLALTLLGAGRAGMRPVWDITRALTGSQDSIPGQDIEAAKQLAHRLKTLPENTGSRLDQIRDLLK